MFNKNDPLIDSVNKVMKENQAFRDAVSAVNEEFGIAGKRDLPFQVHSEYDALVEEMKQEALVGNQHKLDVNKNNRLDKHDFKMLRGMKKKPMEEGKMKDIATEKAEKERLEKMKKPMEEAAAGGGVSAGGSAGGSNTAAKSDKLDTTKTAPQSTITLKPLNKPGLPKLGGMTVAKKNLEEVSKEVAAKYAKAAADDLSDKANPDHGYITGKDEDQIEREAENRRKGIRRAIDKLQKEDRSKKVVGSILTKMRKKAGMEEEAQIDEFITMPSNTQTPADKFNQSKIDATGAAVRKYTNTIQDPAKKAATQAFVGGAAKAAEPVLAKQDLKAPVLSRPTRPGQQTSGPNPMASMAAGRAAERGPAPKPTTPPAPKATTPPPKTIKGPGDTTATMTGRGNDAIVKSGGRTFAGSVVKGLGGGPKIQNFRAGAVPGGGRIGGGGNK